MNIARAIYVVTPVRNGAATIRKTIDSVLAQFRQGQLFYHVQDGGSSDGTIDILRSVAGAIADFPEAYPNVTFSWESSADSGMYDAINKALNGLDIPGDAFVGWLNADDLLADGAVQAVEAAAKIYGVEWVYGLTSVIALGGDEHVKQELYPRALLAAGIADGRFWRFFQQEGCFFRKRLWDAAGGCDSSFKLAGDWDLWRNMADRAEPVFIPQKLGSFVVREGQLSADMACYQAEISHRLACKRRRWRAAQLACFSALRSPILNLETGIIVRKGVPVKDRMRCLAEVLSVRKAISKFKSVFLQCSRLG